MNDMILLRLSIQSALIGEITPNIRRVIVNIIEKKIKLFFFIDGEVTEDMEEEISCIETEVIADFEQGYTIETTIKRVDFPIEINISQGYCVYGKKEYF
ncbi:hypothetical protein PT286_03555 [Neisseriaceae bacterium ESL0693]|nr:hypothetical protein [Neisseriaceae bacterium ESL0693]